MLAASPELLVSTYISYTMQKHTQELKTGWFMKEHGIKPTIDSYLPVKQVPSQVHIDLLANNMCVTIYTNPA